MFGHVISLLVYQAKYLCLKPIKHAPPPSIKTSSTAPGETVVSMCIQI